MNKQRRQQLYGATAALDEAVAVIQDVHFEEDEAFNNLSEGLQCSRTGDSMQEAMDTLLEDRLMECARSCSDGCAEAIELDEKIFYYLSAEEFNRSDEEIRKILEDAIS